MFSGFYSITPCTPSIVNMWGPTSWTAGEIITDWGISEAAKSAPRDMFLPGSPHLLNLSKQCYPPGTQCSQAQDYSGHLIPPPLSDGRLGVNRCYFHLSAQPEASKTGYWEETVQPCKGLLMNPHRDLNNFWMFYLFIHGAYVCSIPQYMCGGQEFVLHLPCVGQGSNADCQAWWQVGWPSEPSPWSSLSSWVTELSTDTVTEKRLCHWAYTSSFWLSFTLWQHLVFPENPIVLTESKRKKKWSESKRVLQEGPVILQSPLKMGAESSSPALWFWHDLWPQKYWCRQ